MRFHYLFAAVYVFSSVGAFSPSFHGPARLPYTRQERLETRLHFFGKGNKDEGNGDPKKTGDDEEQNSGDGGMFPFFGRILNRQKDGEEEEATSYEVEEDSAPAAEKPAEPATVTAVVTEPETKTMEQEAPIQQPEPPVRQPEPQVELSPVERAKALRAQAERARLEAEKLDARLTLEKIEKLEASIEKAKSKGQSTDEFSLQLENLQRKLRGEPPVVPAPSLESDTKTPSTPTTTTTLQPETPPAPAPARPSSVPLGPGVDLSVRPFDGESFDRLLNEFEQMNKGPTKAIVVGMAASVGLPPDKEVNITELCVRMERSYRGDYSFLENVPIIEFSEEKIEEAKKKLKNEEWLTGIPSAKPDLSNMTENQRARMMIAEDTYMNYLASSPDFNEGVTNAFAETLLAAQFPNCIEKEGQDPTEGQTNLVVGLLPAAGFNPTGKPLKVKGGYLITGERKQKDGNKLIESIDEQLTRSGALRDKVTICLVRGPPPSSAEIQNVEFPDLDNLRPEDAIYVLGPDIGREPRYLLKTTSTALGLFGMWYLSVYPFLFNSNLAERIEEQVQLANSGMQTDLAFVTDLSVPLFAAFLGCQLAHEIGHRIAAGVYNIETSVPTFVPSLATGITSSVTSLKSPPKNREHLFDFALAGPVCGILASLATLVIGCQLTGMADSATSEIFPKLPLGILRQSALAGAIIENFLGTGTLEIPPGAEQQLASQGISLHPFAIAGFMSLIVNALALLPIGVTDGGRIAQTMFGRQNKGAVGVLTLLVLLGYGISGNDLFLAYALFVTLCQQGTEVPQRNDVDDISFVRAVLGILAWLGALLILNPMQ